MAKLFPYQLEGAKTIHSFKGRALLADEMGLGKTIQVLYWLKKCPKKRPVIIVCPSSLKWVWEQQALLHTNLKATILEGQKIPKHTLIPSENSIMIANYEILPYWMEYLKKIKPSVLVFDECHYIKSRSAKRTKAVKTLSKNIPHVIAISGTPLVNRPVELFPTLSILWPKQFPNFQPFAFRYCQPKKTPWGWDFGGAAHIEELHDKLKSLGMIRRLKKDVMAELPDKMREVIPFKLSNFPEYQEASSNFLEWLKKKDVSKAKSAAKAESLAKMGYLKRLAAQLKMSLVYEWVDNFLETTDEKIALYAIHKDIINQIHERYAKTSVVVDGNTSQKKRKIAVESFQNSKNTRLFIGNIQAAGTGITLTAACNLAFVELDWVPGNHSQVEDRIHRITQKRCSFIYYFVSKDTIEEHLCKILQSKQETISQTLDGKKTESQLDVMSLLEKSLRVKGLYE